MIYAVRLFGFVSLFLIFGCNPCKQAAKLRAKADYKCPQKTRTRLSKVESISKHAEFRIEPRQIPIFSSFKGYHTSGSEKVPKNTLKIDSVLLFPTDTFVVSDKGAYAKAWFENGVLKMSLYCPEREMTVEEPLPPLKWYQKKGNWIAILVLAVLIILYSYFRRR